MRFFKTPLLKLFPKVSIFTNFPLSILVGMKNKDKQDKKGHRSVSKKAFGVNGALATEQRCRENSTTEADDFLY